MIAYTGSLPDVGAVDRCPCSFAIKEQSPDCDIKKLTQASPIAKRTLQIEAQCDVNEIDFSTDNRQSQIQNPPHMTFDPQNVEPTTIIRYICTMNETCLFAVANVRHNDRTTDRNPSH